MNLAHFEHQALAIQEQSKAEMCVREAFGFKNGIERAICSLPNVVKFLWNLKDSMEALYGAKVNCF